ncbi:Aluminum-activated malate transporter [Dillenia turbinata]|uniref:Aluminum-activated malate transporter n=1 Tax=Dillenia turbinata TaxID=194707 RepID=A0AAN8W9E3_9MAGN
MQTEEIGSEMQLSTGIFSCLCGWFKALIGKYKDKVLELAKYTKKIGKDDPRRVIHSLKVGLALTFVSLFYYTRPLYDGFGISAMWAVLTVVVVFEFSVGATLSKSLNRGFATFLAGALGVGAQHVASFSGEKGEPFLLGTFVFLLAAASAFSRFFPRIKARYDYGVLIFILTFSLVSVSGYHVEKILKLANQRLSTILIGGATCIVISIFICPVWAGEDLHNLVAHNLEKLGSFLEGFGDEYFRISESGEIQVVSKEDKSFLQAYKSVLNSKTTEESLANFASWEPRHGRFGFRHPWKHYLTIATLIRQSAYRVEALNNYINTNQSQAQSEFRRKIQDPCTKMSSESGKALKALASAIKEMNQPSLASPFLANSKTAMNDLRTALQGALSDATDLLEIIPDATVASILVETVSFVEKILEAVTELSDSANFKPADPLGISMEKQVVPCNRGSVRPISDGDIVITIHEKHESK